MLKVTIELLPFGSEDGKKILGVIDIANNGTGTLDRGNYKARVYKRGTPSEWADNIVTGFPRRSSNAYKLLRDILINYKL